MEATVEITVLKKEIASLQKNKNQLEKKPDKVKNLNEYQQNIQQITDELQIEKAKNAKLKEVNRHLEKCCKN